MPAPYDDPNYDHDPDQPRPRKKGGSGPLFFLIALGVLLVGGLIFALIYFLGGSNNFDNEMAAYLPPETNVIAGVEVEDLMKNDKVKNLVTTLFQGEGKEFYAKLKEAGMDENSFSRVLIGGDAGGVGMFGGGPGAGQEPNMVVVIRAKKAFDKAKIAQLVGLTEQTKNGKTYYKSDKQKDVFVHYPSDTLAVLTPSEKAMEGVLSRGDGKVVVSEEMQELAKKLSKGQVWAAVGKAAFEKQLKQAEHLEDMGVPGDIANAAKGMRGFGFYLKLDGDKLTFAGAVLCADKATASKAADAIQKEINEKVRGKSVDQLPLPFPGGKEGGDDLKQLITDIQQSAKADNDGALLEVSASCSVSGLEKLVKSFMMIQGGAVRRQEAHLEAHDAAQAPPPVLNRPRKENQNKMPDFGKDGIRVPVPKPAPSDAPLKK